MRRMSRWNARDPRLAIFNYLERFLCRCGWSHLRHADSSRPPCSSVAVKGSTIASCIDVVVLFNLGEFFVAFGTIRRPPRMVAGREDDVFDDNGIEKFSSAGVWDIRCRRCRGSELAPKDTVFEIPAGIRENPLRNTFTPVSRWKRRLDENKALPLLLDNAKIARSRRENTDRRIHSLASSAIVFHWNRSFTVPRSQGERMRIAFPF